MHVHMSLWKDGTNLFFDPRGTRSYRTRRAGTSGLIKHAAALLAFAAPDDQQLPAAGAGLRGADQPDLLAA